MFDCGVLDWLVLRLFVTTACLICVRLSDRPWLHASFVCLPYGVLSLALHGRVLVQFRMVFIVVWLLISRVVVLLCVCCLATSCLL